MPNNKPIINCRTWSSFMSHYLKGDAARIKFKELYFTTPEIVTIVLSNGSVIAEYRKDYNYFKEGLIYDLPSNVIQLKTESEAQKFIQDRKLRTPDSVKFKYSIYDSYSGCVINDVTLLGLVNKLLILNKTSYIYYEFLPWYKEHVVNVDY